MDWQAAKHGNGVYFTHYNLKFCTQLTFVNGAYIYYSDDRLGYLIPNDVYKTKRGEEFHVTSLTSYTTQPEYLAIRFNDTNNRSYCFLFKSDRSIHEYDPTILYPYQYTRLHCNWIKIGKDIPCFYYNWRLTFFVLFVLSISLFMYGIYQLVRTLYTSTRPRL